MPVAIGAPIETAGHTAGFVPRMAFWVVRRRASTPLEAHDVLARGLPGSAQAPMVQQLTILRTLSQCKRPVSHV